MLRELRHLRSAALVPPGTNVHEVLCCLHAAPLTVRIDLATVSPLATGGPSDIGLFY